MNKQLILVVSLLAIMGGGVAWIAFVLVKAVPILLRVYGAANIMKRRTELLKRVEVAELTERELEELTQLTVELRRQTRGERATRLVERELEAVAVAKMAAARGDWAQARSCLAEIRRVWP